MLSPAWWGGLVTPAFAFMLLFKERGGVRLVSFVSSCFPTLSRTALLFFLPGDYPLTFSPLICAPGYVSRLAHLRTFPTREQVFFPAAAIVGKEAVVLIVREILFDYPLNIH